MTGTLSNVAFLEAAAAQTLSLQNHVTPESIAALIQQLRQISIYAVSDAEARLLVRKLEAANNVIQQIGAVVTEDDFKPWLPEARKEIDPYYWLRYQKLLVKKGLPNRVIQTLDQTTERILGYLMNPRIEGQWDRRGLVMGHVQSGKTANYLGLVTKAADAGYRIIIVIAGIHNSLRNQTQGRVDEGFIGRDSSLISSKRQGSAVGVGLFDFNRQPASFTSAVSDFTKSTANQIGIPLRDLKEPVVFVIKKNSTTLKNLIEWLGEHNAKGGQSKIAEPLLLIDDEADNASINTAAKPDEVTRINGQIRSLLNLFERSSYVGYTATPFANIFINPDSVHEMFKEELFPRHFIVSLDPPSNYFGASRVFLEDLTSHVREIDDHETIIPLKHKSIFEPPRLPESLKEAIREFILARAIRLARGETAFHSSMLVHVSRYTKVQAAVRSQVDQYLTELKQSIRIYGGTSNSYFQIPILQSLRQSWMTEFSNAGDTWENIAPRLNEAVAPILVALVNSASSEGLKYAEHTDTGLSVIAVGGDSLSRGLTLEGLTISYFLRNSKAYDTLMQMGRWFGYRPGYDDLCRVWLTEEATDWYVHIAGAIEELRGELAQMERLGLTPRDFGLKVRAHPTTLIVTAQNKMRSGENVVTEVGLSNKFVETSILTKRSQDMQTNRAVTRALAKELTEAGINLGNGAKDGQFGYFFRNVPAGPILNFLNRFENHPASILTNRDLIVPYIESRLEKEMMHWDLLIPSLIKTDSTPMIDSSLLGLEIVCQRRREGTHTKDRMPDRLAITDKNRVATRGIERVGLRPDDVVRAETDYLRHHPRSPGATLNFPDFIYREYRTRPLFVLHLLRIAEKDDLKISQYDEPVVAWSISFPKTHQVQQTVKYTVNVKWMKLNFFDIFDGDGDGDDIDQ